jgi:ribosomal protein S4
MSFVEEHLDIEATVLMAVVASFWGVLRYADSLYKDQVKSGMSRIEKSIDELKAEVNLIGNDMVNQDQVVKMDNEMTEIQKQINLLREKTVSEERMAKMDKEFQGLRETIQKTREAMIQGGSTAVENEKRTEATLARLEKRLDMRCSKMGEV